MNLTEKQQLAIDNAFAAIDRQDRVYKIGGYAGTGKTTVAKYIKEKLNLECMPCAFTGKAALRLRQKGIPEARTIHSTIYYCNPKNKEFYLRDELDGDWFMVDEASMISKLLWDDLQTFKLSILLIGDPGQLEPVGNDPQLMLKCDIVLDEIHRQASESGIIQFATDVRLSNILKKTYKDIEFLKYMPSSDELLWANIILCGFNRTRCQINSAIRNRNKRRNVIEVGEPIIILQNNRLAGVFNGQILTVETVDSIQDEVVWVTAITDDGEEHLELQLKREQFGKEKLIFEKRQSANPFERVKYKTEKEKDLERRLVYADYGYATTCHKSQGSEWDKVLVIDEQCDLWNPVRWRYTAITRAAKELKFFSRSL
jgi:exodeoxyribonuclease-5